MLHWLRGRDSAAHQEHQSPAAKPSTRQMSGKYQLLYKYLEERYANTVVLTFAEIEDLLGFALPDQARSQHEWWTTDATKIPQPNYSDSWILARRTAKPNMLAQTVAFERGS